MWRRKKKESKPREKRPGVFSRLWKGMKDNRALGALRFVGLGIVLGGVVVGAVVGMRALDRRVRELPAQVEAMSYRLRLADRPAWMPSSLVRQIAQSIVPQGVSFGDPSLAGKMHAAAAANPWAARVHKVTKQRTDDPQLGLVEVYAEYRQPFALVGNDGKYHFIDAEGVRLPDDQAPRWQAMVKAEGDSQARHVQYASREDVPEGLNAWCIHYVTIDGIASPPPAPGQRWQGQDLQEGMRLVRAIAGRRWADQITVIDVRNHNWRLDRKQPQLVLYARNGEGERTQIRFGRFALPGDYEIPTEVKLAHLDNYAAEHNGRLAGYNSYIDIRHEQWLANSN